MIMTTLTPLAIRRWRDLATQARAGWTGPHVARLPGGLSIEAKVEGGLMFAIFTADQRDLEADEEAELKAACNVPDVAERVPMAGQERVSHYRRGIVDVQPKRKVTYWWAL